MPLSPPRAADVRRLIIRKAAIRGIRSGQDMLKALAMGAKGTFIGRALVCGLGAMGESGVTCAFEVIRRELDLTMALCGELDHAALERRNLLIPRISRATGSRHRRAPSFQARRAVL